MGVDLSIDIERRPLRAPFRITGYTITEAAVVIVTLTEGGITGRGEAAGVHYLGETPEGIARQIESVRSKLEAGVSRQTLQSLLPPGGARNAVDCALWDVEARVSGIPAWRIAGLHEPTPLPTTYTIGADTAEAMARAACSYARAPRLKIKLTGEDDAARLRAVRAARPDAWIAIDANRAYDGKTLRALLPLLLELDVRLIEQPVPIGREAELGDIDCPIPLAADESVQSLADLPNALGLFDIVNIKLDKCGGLTEALQMAVEIRRLGMKPMVGCMEGTSLAMSPACLVGQRCDLVDLDAPLFLSEDRTPPAVYGQGTVWCPKGWGLPAVA